MDELLNDAIAGSRAARDELTRLHSDEVDASVRRGMGERMRRQHAVDDLRQEVFLRVFQSLHTLEQGSGIGAFRARLFQTVKWVVAQKGKRGERFVGESGAPNHAVPSPSPSTGPVTMDDESRWLRELAERLGPKYGRVILMRAEGRSYPEIAEALGEQESTVRKRYQRAFQMLRQVIDGRRGETQ